ncbi:hypothetical protein [Antiquaquibacter soli]|uniref:Uncharacterized protein n=1 Tax=Antiquaquibacter soli TaxID=3064523 RepID=A0ABT9BWL7_9MICO|nr:hypothetical protein [Protaetiibacter sp. WY-16]MDO7883707.1 hypothetical protein [Protaetiibacter sp. WY-16]
MTNTTPTPDSPDDDAPTALGDGWVEKDGDVLPEEIDEVLPEAQPTEGQQPLP